MTDFTMPFAAAKIDIAITDDNGNTVRYSFDDFDYVEVETMKETEYFPSDAPYHFSSTRVSRLSQLSFHISHPREYRIYAPHLIQGIDGGDIVEEG